MNPIDFAAQANHQRIIELKQQATRSFILLGQALKDNKEHRYFESLGHLTFEAYIESPVVGLSRSSVYSLIGIYQTFVEELDYSLDELSEVDYSKLDRIIPLINVQPVGHRDWFEKAKTLPRRTLEQEVKRAWEQENTRMPTPPAPALPDNGLADWLNTVQCGDCLQLLRQLPDDSINCCVTSPPYWGLRDFGVEGQLGTEETFHDYIEQLCHIFDEVRRVLKPDGTCWVNMGDTYASSPAGNRTIHYDGDGVYGRLLERHTHGGTAKVTPKPKDYGSIPNKCLLQIPTRFSIEMCNRGWILRNEIIWHKPNCMPSSVKDRFTVDFEKLFFFTKSERYWFETQYESQGAGDDHIANHTAWESDPLMVRGKNALMRYNPLGRNKRCVWRIPTQPFPEAHFAVFPEKLIETPIQSGCPELVCTRCGKGREKRFESEFILRGTNDNPETYRQKLEEEKGNRSLAMVARKGVGRTIHHYKGLTSCGCNADFIGGIVLDPFCGSGTTLVVAKELGRQYLGFDINPGYVEMTIKRLQ